MKYYQAKFKITPFDETACDVLTALLADIGFETFTPTEEGCMAYVRQSLFVADALTDLERDFLLPGYSIEHTVEEAPDEDWNQTWEEEGFAPIVIDDLVCVHDTRHRDVPTCRYDILINPRMAFGTGSHPTTRQILRQLCQTDLQGKRVVDAGCGTGVLGILCALRGAGHVFSYDIDSWSVENSGVNARLNGIENLEIREGDASVLPQTADYDLLIANINRNILLADLPRFSGALAPHARLLLSGFYEADIDSLVEKSKMFGFSLTRQTSEDGWAMLLLQR